MAGYSFLDRAKDVATKARHTAVENRDKIENAVDKTAGFVDEKTKGKYAKHVGKAQGAAHKAVGRLDDTQGDQPGASTSEAGTGGPTTPRDPGAPTAEHDPRPAPDERDREGGGASST